MLAPYVAMKTVLLITAYGVRSNFLHLPLIFIFPAVMNLEDVKRIGRWTVIGMIPMAILMAFAVVMTAVAVRLFRWDRA